MHARSSSARPRSQAGAARCRWLRPTFSTPPCSFPARSRGGRSKRWASTPRRSRSRSGMTAPRLRRACASCSSTPTAKRGCWATTRSIRSTCCWRCSTAIRRRRPRRCRRRVSRSTTCAGTCRPEAGRACPHTATRPDASLRRRPWPSLRGVLGLSPVFGAIAGVTAASGAALWFHLLPAYTPVWTVLFVVGGWVVSLCIHEFGHAFVAYLGGDRSVVGAGYLTLDPLHYGNLTVSVILPIIFLLLGGIALPGGAVYINHSALRTRAWSSAVSLAGPLGTLLCGAVIAAIFAVAVPQGWISGQTFNFFAALALLGFFMAFAVVLNLVPLPGLDGFGVLRPWLPYSVQYTAMRFSLFAIYGVFALLWFVAPVRDAFFGVVYQLTALVGIDQALIYYGQLNMRFL